jgi:3-phenylpropionate/cinnamic acid dioxygenase small subunit
LERTALQAIVDRQAIVDTIVRYAAMLDAKDWAGAKTCFAGEVETDYGDLRGTGPTRVAAHAFVELRRQALERLKTHHVSTNHLVTLDGDRATCQSAMLIHRLDPSRETDNTFDTLAHYTHTLVRTPRGWRITRVRQSVAWNRGNPAIHAGARPERNVEGRPGSGGA